MKKILIVDDEPQNIKVLSNLLKDQYKLAAATGGEAALQLAQTEPQPDLILLDIMMPGMNGYEVIGRLRANAATKGIPVIFVSAKDEINDKLDGYELGAVDYLTKPIDPDFAVQTIKRHIDGKKP